MNLLGVTGICVSEVVSVICVSATVGEMIDAETMRLLQFLRPLLSLSSVFALRIPQ
jgi:hypothetical protein